MGKKTFKVICVLLLIFSTIITVNSPDGIIVPNSDDPGGMGTNKPIVHNV